jgi:hypothetical protein
MTRPRGPLPYEFITPVSGEDGVIVGRLIWPSESSDPEQARDEVTQMVSAQRLEVSDAVPTVDASGVVWVTCTLEGSLADLRRWIPETQIRKLWYPPLAAAATFPPPDSNSAGL